MLMGLDWVFGDVRGVNIDSTEKMEIVCRQNFLYN